MFYYRPVIKTDQVKPGKFIGVLCSLVLHLCLLLIGGMVFIKPIEYAVDKGLSGMDVQLVAGVQEPVEAPAAVIPEPVEKIVPVPVSEPIPVMTPEPLPEIIPEPIAEPIVESAPSIIQESVITPVMVQEKIEMKKSEKIIPPQPVPQVVKGNSSVNVSSTGQGAQTEVKPAYLSNPAPRYPLDARRNGWEGVVVLKAFVDKSGRPTKVELEKSSGYSSLDESALKTVKTWRFRAARIGKMVVESSVRLPVRFELNDL
jgi:protein TonB